MSNMINRKEKKNRCFLLLYACLFLSFFVLQLFPQVSEEHIAPGVIFQERYLSEGPWAVQIVTIQREKPGIYLEAVLGTPYILGIEPLTRIIDRHTYPGHYPIAGINGDFYILRIDPFQGDPSGLCIINYEIVSSPNNRSVFAILDDGTPRLIRNGIISIEGEEEGVSPAFTETRHPRTAIGFNASHIFLVVVDGRQPGYSVGMSLSELAYLMKELGAVEALNLDGGGSTTMWVQGKIRNRPSDGFIRPVANGLIVVSENKPK